MPHVGQDLAPQQGSLKSPDGNTSIENTILIQVHKGSFDHFDQIHATFLADDVQGPLLHLTKDRDQSEENSWLVKQVTMMAAKRS